MTSKEYRARKLKNFFDSLPKRSNETHDYATLSNGVKVEIVNMSSEEYIKPRGLSSYEDIKRKLKL